MPQRLPELNIDKLSTDQRLELIGLLWDSLSESLEAMPVPDWHRRELERRLADADASPEAGIPWDRIRDRFQHRS